MDTDLLMRSGKNVYKTEHVPLLGVSTIVKILLHVSGDVQVTLEVQDQRTVNKAETLNLSLHDKAGVLENGILTRAI